jgi:hypothetical protein
VLEEDRVRAAALTGEEGLIPSPMPDFASGER